MASSFILFWGECLCVHPSEFVCAGGNWLGYRSYIAKPSARAPNCMFRWCCLWEVQILKLLAQGWDNVRIANELHLAEQTVRNRVSRIYAKIGASSRAEAIVWARERGLE